MPFDQEVSREYIVIATNHIHVVQKTATYHEQQMAKTCVFFLDI